MCTKPPSFLEFQGRLAVAFETSYEELGDAGGLGEDPHGGKVGALDAVVRLAGEDGAAEFAAYIGERGPVVAHMGAVSVPAFPCRPAR
jgi:hypothetical protein